MLYRVSLNLYEIRMQYSHCLPQDDKGPQELRSLLARELSQQRVHQLGGGKGGPRVVAARRTKATPAAPLRARRPARAVETVAPHAQRGPQRCALHVFPS